jgi:hypothetical protein
MSIASAPDSAAMPHLPAMISTGDELTPKAPVDARDTGVSPAVLSDLALKAAYTVPQFTTEWAARRLHLSQPLMSELLEQLRSEQLLDILGSSGPFGYRYSISGRGRERAGRLLEVSGYIGPAPVSLEAYRAMIEWQLARASEVCSRHVSDAISGLVLPEESRLLAGLAISSGRSLFLHGPPGNGKSSLGRALHGALQGDLWIPHCIGIEDSIIRIFDAQIHQVLDGPTGQPWAVDSRWVRVRRPLIVAGGELTLDSFDLAYSPSLHYYEAPLHVKANGGTFLIDDFGRQRVKPHVLLNRWILPLEHQIDYLTLHTGQKIQVPFRLSLIISTNLDLADVTDPAFLRRMGYRLQLGPPSPERYAEIFRRHADRIGTEIPPGLLDRLLDRYDTEGRERRSCEPRDLIERIRDICRYRDLPLQLSEETLDLAWTGYFGQNSARAQPTAT